MWCIKCQHDVVECECEDILQRLESLYETGLGLAAKQNVKVRKLLRDDKLDTTNAA